MTDETPVPITGPVLVLAPHPDDDAIGCGGTIARLVREGQTVHVLYLTSGEMGCPGVDPAVVLEWRERDARNAAAVLGVASTTFWEEPDGALAETPGIILRLQRLIRDLGVRSLLVTHGREDHADHRAARGLAFYACVVLDDAARPALWNYEVWTPMASYDLAVDISDVIDVKIAAIREHKSQVDRIAFDEAARGLSRYRGELHNRPHGPYAEVFSRTSL